MGMFVVESFETAALADRPGVLVYRLVLCEHVDSVWPSGAVGVVGGLPAVGLPGAPGLDDLASVGEGLDGLPSVDDVMDQLDALAAPLDLFDMLSEWVGVFSAINDEI